MVRSEKGFTLIELIIVLAIVAILSAFSVPVYVEWSQQAAFREAAYSVVASMNLARREAIAQKREHRVEFDFSTRQFRLTRGNRAAKSTTYTDIVRDWSQFTGRVALRANSDCLGTSDIDFTFSPLGTSSSNGTTDDVCIMEDPVNGGPLIPKYRVRIASTTTGRIVMEKI